MMMLYLPGYDTGRAYLFLYQHRHPELRGGFYLVDWCAGILLAGEIGTLAHENPRGRVLRGVSSSRKCGFSATSAGGLVVEWSRGGKRQPEPSRAEPGPFPLRSPMNSKCP